MRLPAVVRRSFGQRGLVESDENREMAAEELGFQQGSHESHGSPGSHGSHGHHGNGAEWHGYHASQHQNHEQHGHYVHGFLASEIKAVRMLIS